MSHDPYDLSGVLPQAITRARQLLDDARRNACGESGMVLGWWVESHALGCPETAEDAEGRLVSHWTALEKYERDETVRIMADRETGAFVTMTPRKGTISMGAARKRRVKPTKMKLARAESLAAVIQGVLEPYLKFSQVVGSVRRRAPEVGDVELVVLPRDLSEFLDFLGENGFTGGDRKQVGHVGKNFPIEIYIAHDPKELGGLVLMYTGDFALNIAMRMKAKKRGLKLNQYGIWQGAKPVLQSEDEVDFFEFLGMRYHEPEERSLARRGKPKKAVRAPKMGGDDDDFERFWCDEEE